MTSTRQDNGGRVVVLLILGLIVLFGSLYAVAYAFAADRVPRGASVAGIEIGGTAPDEAEERLEKAFAERDGLQVEIAGRQVQLSATEIGLDVDEAASVEAAGGGRSWKPARLWDYYTGGDDLEPVVTIDQELLDTALDSLNERFGRPAVEGDVVFTKAGGIRTVKARNGLGVDPVEGRDLLEAAYVAGESVQLDLGPLEPEISDEDVADAVEEFAETAVSGPVTLRFDGTPVTLAPQAFAPALAMSPEDGVLVPDLAEEKLATIIDARLGDKGRPVDATVRLRKGVPTVIPGKPGVAYEPEDIADTFLEVVAETGEDRELDVEATVQEPEFTTEEAQALKITEKVSSFTTYFPHADYRNVNVGRAAEIINGTVLKPGETFSLNDTVGERTEENGFTTGYIINDGILVQDLGGGVSQMATTLFNAAFFAGLEDVEHKPHSFYIDRYPVGREATVAWGAVDLRFKNDTPYGVLIKAHLTPSTWSSQGVVTVTMYSTKYWDITTKTGRRYNFTEPKTRTLTTDSCEPHTGYGGFDIDIWRYFRRDGELVETEKMHTTYIPSDTVVCKEPEKPRTSTSPSPTAMPTGRG